MKILKKLSIVLIITIMLCGCSKKEYVKEISFKEFKQKMENKETFPVYVGNDHCGHCKSYRPTLERFAKENKIEIYYVNNEKFEEDEYYEFSDYINISGTPTVAFITDGYEESSLTRIVGDIGMERTIERFKLNGYLK